MKQRSMRRLLHRLSVRRHSRWRLALGLMVLVVAAGTLGYMLIARMGFVDALYQTVVTVTTVGYTDLALERAEDLEAAGRTGIANRVKVFDIILVVFGIGAIAYSFSVFIQSLIEGELREAIGLRRAKRRVHFMKNHFIICGFGRMGAIIAESLQRDRIPAVVIERNPEKRKEIQDMGLVCLTGDATNDETLREAAIEKARGLIAVTDSDPENLFVTLSARQLNPNLNIVSRVLSPESEQKLLRAGANRVILPYKLGAHQIAQAALRPNVVDFIEIATRTSKLDIEIEEIPVNPESELAGKKLHEATILRRLGLIVIGVRSGADDQMRFNPSAETVMNGRDTLIVLGKKESLAQIRDLLS